jgi:hypothetical protein
MSRTRDRALDAVERVLYLNKDEFEGIRALCLGTTPGEDDLKVFENDEGFTKISGGHQNEPVHREAVPRGHASLETSSQACRHLVVTSQITLRSLTHYQP